MKRAQSVPVPRFSEFPSAPSPGRPTAFRPVFIRSSVSDVTRPGMVARHQHMAYEVIFVDRGVYRCVHNTVDVTLEENDLLVVKPGDWHTDIFDGQQPLRYLGLGFSLELGSGMPLSIFREGTPVERQHQGVNRADFVPLLERIWQESRVGDFVSGHIQDAIVLEFFYRMIRAIPRDILSDVFVNTSDEASFSSGLLSAIHSRITSKISVAELADALGVSESSLAHKSREILGCSPLRLVGRIKMDRARQMLANTDMSVKEVASYLGFEDPFHFSRAFKRAFGMAPSQVKDAPPVPMNQRR